MEILQFAKFKFEEIIFGVQSMVRKLSLDGRLLRDVKTDGTNKAHIDDYVWGTGERNTGTRAKRFRHNNILSFGNRCMFPINDCARFAFLQTVASSCRAPGFDGMNATLPGILPSERQLWTQEKLALSGIFVANLFSPRQKIWQLASEQL